MEDTQKELQRLEQELLDDEARLAEEMKDQELNDIFLDEELLREVLTADAEPAFEDPDKIHEPEGPMVYCNYSNDYGKDLQDFAETGETQQDNKKDKVLIGLMITASALCMGIIAILIYWLAAFLS